MEGVPGMRTTEDFALWLSDILADHDDVELIDDGGYGAIIVVFADDRPDFFVQAYHNDAEVM